MLIEIIDISFLAAAAILPICFVLKWGWKGMILGALAVWISLILAGIVLAGLDPEREVAMLDTVWLFSGWIAGLGYSGIIYLVRMIFVRLKK